MVADPETLKFYADHVAQSPKNVIMVTLIFMGDMNNERHAIFSDYAKAQAWIDSVERQLGSFAKEAVRGTVTVPYIIDEPDYGNIPANKQQ